MKDLWFIDIDRKNDEFIRSMTINNPKIPLKLNTNKESSFLNVPSLVLVRNNTTRLPNEEEAGKTRQEVLKSLKSLGDVDEEESMIYGYGEKG